MAQTRNRWHFFLLISADLRLLLIFSVWGSLFFADICRKWQETILIVFWETPVCSLKFCSQSPCPLPPPPYKRSHGYALELLVEGPQTKFRTLSQNYEQLPQNCAQTEV